MKKSYSIIDKIIAQHIIAQPKKEKVMIEKNKIKNISFEEKRFTFPKNNEKDGGKILSFMQKAFSPPTLSLSLSSCLG